jgi:hypothetical protein
MEFRILCLLVVLVVSCASPARPGPDTPVTSPPGGTMPADHADSNPFAPKSGDENLSRGAAYLDEASLVIRESYPPQISLSISGDLPTPCNELRVKIDRPDPENKINIDVYSVVDPDKVCIQVLEPLQEYIDLGTYSPGHYSVWVNGELSGEFDA